MNVAIPVSGPKRPDPDFDFRPILDSMTDMILVKGPRSRLLWANRAFREFYGMTNEELRDVVDGPQSDPDDTVHYVRDDHRVFTSGEPLDIPSEAVTNHEGKVQYFHTVKTAVRDESGAVYQTASVSRRIASKEDDERERQQRKDTLSSLRALVAGIPLPVVMCDTSTRVLEQSDAWATFVGLHARGPEVTYDEAFEAHVPAHELLEEVTASGAEARRAAVHCKPRGRSTRTADLTARAWYLPDGDIGGAILVAHDVTDAARNQAALERANEELVQFSYRASHDLRGPLRTCLGFLQLVHSKIQKGKANEALPLIGRASRRLEDLSGLVEDLLSLARAELDSMAVQHFSLREMLEQCFESFGELLQEFEVELDLRVDELSVDAVRLRQILDNLISNAIKYRDPAVRGGEIAVRSRLAEGTVVIEVEDMGLGFEQPRRAFQSFYRERKADAPGGVGLGLSIVRKHLERLGGRVEITSPAKPTILTIEVPSMAHAKDAS